MPTAKKPSKPRKPKAAPSSRGLTAADIAQAPPEAVELASQITEDGGTVLAAYKDPLKGSGLVLAALPIEQIERTPWQRDLSDAHMKKLADVIDRVGVYLDPIIATREAPQKYHSPNGGHRLEAMRKLGAKAIPALVVPDRAIAWRILALNTEKAHALKEKALEVWRMETAMDAEDQSRRENAFELEFEEAALITLGAHTRSTDACPAARTDRRSSASRRSSTPPSPKRSRSGARAATSCWHSTKRCPRSSRR
jgi:ParB family chromosome partitioning protein